MQIKELIITIISQLKDRDMKIQKTKLLKLAYLTEIHYFRKYRERLTNTEWLYYKYGPYVREYDSIINEKEFIKYQSTDSDFQNIDLVYHNRQELNTKEKTIINYVLNRYSKEPLPEILEHIYFDTEPMMNIDKRGEILDFNSVLPEEFYKSKDITITNDLRKKIKKMLNSKKEQK